MSVLQELVDLPAQQKDALGLAATSAEIAQQPATWQGTRALFTRHRARICSFLQAAGIPASPNAEATANTDHRPVVILTGAGSSDYIGQALALLLRTTWGCETQAIPSTDLLTNMAALLIPGRRYLCISFSRSGGSPEGIAVLTQALEHFPAVAHLIVTCNEHGRMLQVARQHPQTCAIVLDDAVNDRSLAMTSSYTNMVVLGQCLAHAFTPEVYDPIFTALVAAGEAFLPIAAASARRLADARHPRVCILGSAALTAVAKESALKVLEMTAGRVKTMSESVLGLRHGPMAALDPDTLLVCFVSSDPRRRQYEADLLREVGDKHIVAARVVIAPAAVTQFADCSEHLLPLNDGVPDLYRPPVDVIFGQLLGLYASLAHGLKPDSPSPGGVISRVVAEFKIY